MSSRNSVVGARRALSSSALVSMLRIREFPTVALFRRDHQQALYMNRLVFIFFPFILTLPVKNLILLNCYDSVALMCITKIIFSVKSIIFRFGNETYTDLDRVIMQDSRAMFGQTQFLLTSTTQRPTTTTTQTPLIDCHAYPERYIRFSSKKSGLFQMQRHVLRLRNRHAQSHGRLSYPKVKIYILRCFL